MKNEDDASALLCVFRGQAFRQQGFHDAAHEALKEALRSKSRAAPIRQMALAERAQNYLRRGRKEWRARTSSAFSPRIPTIRMCVSSWRSSAHSSMPATPRGESSSALVSLLACSSGPS
jgi:hypothetical protein